MGLEGKARGRGWGEDEIEIGVEIDSEIEAEMIPCKSMYLCGVVEHLHHAITRESAEYHEPVKGIGVPARTRP